MDLQASTSSSYESFQQFNCHKLATLTSQLVLEIQRIDKLVTPSTVSSLGLSDNISSTTADPTTESVQFNTDNDAACYIIVTLMFYALSVIFLIINTTKENQIQYVMGSDKKLNTALLLSRHSSGEKTKREALGNIK
jgi:hypothetical protein